MVNFGLRMSRIFSFNLIVIFNINLKTFLRPFGYTDALPRNYADMVAKSAIATAAIKRVNGVDFTIGSSTRLLCNKAIIYDFNN
jgi:hypothetical protein